MNEPALWPNNWLSINSPGIAAQLTDSIGRSARGLARWIARATNSLPDPLSPRISTQPVVRATRLILAFRSFIGGHSPISSLWPDDWSISRR